MKHIVILPLILLGDQRNIKGTPQCSSTPSLKTVDVAQCPPFTGGESEVQRGVMTWSGSE